MKTSYALTRTEYERELDTALAGSFPASDPPPWTFGASPWMEVAAPILGRPVPAAVDVIVRDGYRVGGIRLAGLGAAISMAAMVPLAILIAGVPVVVLVWGFVNALKWLTGSG